LSDDELGRVGGGYCGGGGGGPGDTRHDR